jgi:hypothetical protein
MQQTVGFMQNTYCGCRISAYNAPPLTRRQRLTRLWGEWEVGE